MGQETHSNAPSFDRRRWHLDHHCGCVLKTPPAAEGEIVGFGGWLYVDGDASVTMDASVRFILKVFAPPDWGKFGSQWYSTVEAEQAVLTVQANGETIVALMAVEAGLVHHDHLSNAPDALMTNMHEYAPEANFIVDAGIVEVSVDGPSGEGPDVEIYLKSCNRCARYLPINVNYERNQLSFSNHCVAERRRPCSHNNFGRLVAADSSDELRLEYGYQLECRFCKKFEVNAAHNPQRTAAQMKEDALRRRAFELLLTELYEGSPALLYRRRSGGSELAEDVYERFEHRCFKCGVELPTARDMELDHTRPLALLYPLDETATALCPVHNSEKRDRPPSEYYDKDELSRLAELTGLSLAELQDPSPNRDAIERLLARIEWFYSVFLQRPEMLELNDGKRPADLLMKALQKVFDRADVTLDLAEGLRSQESSITY